MITEKSVPDRKIQKTAMTEPTNTLNTGKKPEDYQLSPILMSAFCAFLYPCLAALRYHFTASALLFLVAPPPKW